MYCGFEYSPPIFYETLILLMSMYKQILCCRSFHAFYTVRLHVHDLPNCCLSVAMTTDSVHLVDYEYAGPNFIIFDIANPLL